MSRVLKVALVGGFLVSSLPEAVDAAARGGTRVRARRSAPRASAGRARPAGLAKDAAFKRRLATVKREIKDDAWGLAAWLEIVPASGITQKQTSEGLYANGKNRSRKFSLSKLGPGGRWEGMGMGVPSTHDFDTSQRPGSKNPTDAQYAKMSQAKQKEWDKWYKIADRFIRKLGRERGKADSIRVTLHKPGGGVEQVASLKSRGPITTFPMAMHFDAGAGKYEIHYDRLVGGSVAGAATAYRQGRVLEVTVTAGAVK